MRKDVVAPPEIDRRVSEREIAIETARHPGAAREPYFIAARAAAYRRRDGLGRIKVALHGDVRIGRVDRGAPHPVCARRHGKGEDDCKESLGMPSADDDDEGPPADEEDIPQDE